MVKVVIQELSKCNEHGCEPPLVYFCLAGSNG